MTKKIFRSIISVAGVVLLASLIIITSILYSYFDGLQARQLKEELNLAVAGIEQGGTAFLTQLDGERCRLTWVDQDGSVLYDTKADAETLENHGDREEIREALEQGEGASARYSDTRLEKTLYQAKRLEDGTVLRLSVSQATAVNLALGLLRPVVLVLAAALVLSFLLADRIARRIVEPLERLDLERPLENDTYEELTPVLKRIHQQRGQIREQLKELRRKNDEFEQITGNMKEGLVLLGEKGDVLSINSAARALFHAEQDCVGREFLAVDRSPELDRTIQSALASGHGELRLQRDGREYQLDVSRIESENRVMGAVLLSFDVTEQTFAERNRREFTANVSHELKTPLQSIMGSAELMENGLVKEADVPRFVERIRSEAARLLALIEDTIRLSQLDEGGELPVEPVDLYQLAQEELHRLEPLAADRGVALSVQGGETTVRGIRQLLHEVVHNLCDNALKYNVEGGSVTVALREDRDSAVLSVADTGIGIPPEHQARVFERFYRVDKSHSKETGGTGLGLSIVKHAVQAMGGSIELESRPGEGTTISVRLPKGV